MAKAKQVFTDASFKSDGIESIVFLAGSTIVFLVAVTLLALGNSGVPEVLQGLIQGFGRFFQVSVILVLASEGVFFARMGFISKWGNFSGACPYCGTANELRVRYPTQPSGKNCSKCKKRFVLKDGKFYQLDSPSRLDAKFSGIKNGIGLVHKGIAIACLVPIAVVAGLFFGVATMNLLFIIAPIVLLLISVAMQIFGVWQCLQTPDRISPKRWITATVWLEGITLVLLVGKFLFTDAGWLDFLLVGVGFAGQFTFFTFLIKLSNFIQRSDLAVEFEELLHTTFLVFGGLLVEPLVPDSYKTPLFIIALTLAGFNTFGYLGDLKQLETHLGRAITAR
jgi:hypothetical protein